MLEYLLKTFPPGLTVFRFLAEAELLDFLVIAELYQTSGDDGGAKTELYLGNTNGCFEVVTGFQDLQSTVEMLEVSSKSNLNKEINAVIICHSKVK